MPHDEWKGHLFTLGFKRSKSHTVTLTALRFVVEYGPMCDRLGEAPSIDDYAAHVGLSLSQAYRRQAAFRQCFPEDDVQRIWAIVKAELVRSPFKNEAPLAQAIFAGSLKVTAE